MGNDKARKIKNDFKYRVDITWSPEDKAYVVRVPELEGCVTHGATMEEAVIHAKEAIAVYLESLKARGEAVPKPLAEQKFTGKIPLRIDPNLHRDLVVKAQIEGTSLNKYIERTLKKSS